MSMAAVHSPFAHQLEASPLQVARQFMSESTASDNGRIAARRAACDCCAANESRLQHLCPTTRDA
jgi:hypothetical protein